MELELLQQIGRQAADDVQARFPLARVECLFSPIPNDPEASLIEVLITTEDNDRAKLYTYGAISHQRYPKSVGLQAVLTSYIEQCVRDFLNPL